MRYDEMRSHRYEIYALTQQTNNGIDTILKHVQLGETFTEPFVAAIDTTAVPFHVSPWKAEDDIEPDDERIVVDEKTGKTKMPKEDYPEVVNNSKNPQIYEYQYTILIIIGRNTPLVLTVEPVKHDST